MLHGYSYRCSCDVIWDRTMVDLPVPWLPFVNKTSQCSQVIYSVICNKDKHDRLWWIESLNNVKWKWTPITFDFVTNKAHAVTIRMLILPLTGFIFYAKSVVNGIFSSHTNCVSNQRWHNIISDSSLPLMDVKKAAVFLWGCAATFDIWNVKQSILLCMDFLSCYCYVTVTEFIKGIFPSNLRSYSL